MNICSLSLPMPNDKWTNDHRTVIASTWLRDYKDKWIPPQEPDFLCLVMILNPEPPYYTVMQLMANQDSRAWDVAEYTNHMNINHATDDYADSGGDV